VIDKQGVIRFAKVYPLDQQPDIEELFRALEEIQPVASAGSLSLPAAEKSATASPVSAQPAAPAQPPPAGDVIMYCTPWCPACRRAKAFFAENNIQFTEIDITRDRVAAQRVRGWANGNETTPTFDIKGTIIVEFDKVKVAKALGLPV
jgi:glutaredoxin